MVQLLLDRGAAVNAANHEGGTALHDAVRRGHADIVQVLQRGCCCTASLKRVNMLSTGVACSRSRPTGSWNRGVLQGSDPATVAGQDRGCGRGWQRRHGRV
jgi:hypothetical protein